MAAAYAASILSKHQHPPALQLTCRALLVLQNGQKVRSVSELQDIDELCVVEVSSRALSTANYGHRISTNNHRICIDGMIESADESALHYLCNCQGPTAAWCL